MDQNYILGPNKGGIHVSILPPEKRRGHGPNLQTIRLSRRQGGGYKARSEESSEESQIQVRCPV